MAYGMHSGYTRHAEPMGRSLFGWAGIEDHLMKYDTGKIKDFMDDIDTLLVFAGLFSAVLTAFVVQTYELLQPPGQNMVTTNQLLLYGLSPQLEAARLSFPASINATFNALLSPMSFIPPLSARWINGLFFVSLVLSLAAALFGILAKQWLREYLQWNSPLSSPRENVVIRQIRSEALSTWNIASTISTIPALLELAVIMFLVGIVILLWTLDNVLATIVTCFVVILLGIASAFTILPILFVRCPYKSPTAWACVNGYHLASAPIVYYTKRFYRDARIIRFGWRYMSALQDKSFYSRCRDLFTTDWYDHWAIAHPRFEKAAWPTRSRSWRERDLESIAVTKLAYQGWRKQPMDAREAARLELTRELIPLKEDGAFVQDPDPKDADNTDADALLLDISETSLLLRALSWVQQASQEPRVNNYVAECMDSIHRKFPALPQGRSSQIQNVTNWCIIASLQQGFLHEPHLALGPSPPNNYPLHSVVTNMRRATGVHSLRRGLSPGFFHQSNINLQLGHVDSQYPASHMERLVLQFLCVCLRQSMTGLQDTEHLPAPHVGVEVRRIFEMFSLLHMIGTERSMLGAEWYLDSLRAILCNKSLDRLLDAHAPSLRLGAFQLACRYTAVTFDKGEGKLILSRGQTGLPEHETLLIEYFESEFSLYSDTVLNFFVVSAIKWLYHVQLSTSDVNRTATQILDKMARAVEAIIDRRGRMFCNEDADDDAWITALWRNKSALSTYYGPVFRRLLHHFQRSYCDNILFGDKETICQYLHSSLEESHRGLHTCDSQPACQWLSHKCTGWWDCSVLPRYLTDAPRTPLSHGERRNAARPPPITSTFRSNANNTEECRPMRIDRILQD